MKHPHVFVLFLLVLLRSQGSGDRYKLLMMKLSEDQRTIVMDHQESLKIKDLVSGEDVFKKVVGMFPENDCRYAVYDCSYTFSGHVRKALVLITWVPDSTPTKTKMAYLSSKDSLLKRFQGLGFQLQWSFLEDTSDLVKNLGGAGVVSLEGNPL
ncbi:cofilin-2-like isoform X4 [Hoplias malabaricus]|uniref:cofilin-2-like isoform X4 n=1 Tax=Hoplias malabaricus TaxID=27720 RepID=UPI003462C191